MLEPVCRKGGNAQARQNRGGCTGRQEGKRAKSHHLSATKRRAAIRLKMGSKGAPNNPEEAMRTFDLEVCWPLKGVPLGKPCERKRHAYARKCVRVGRAVCHLSRRASRPPVSSPFRQHAALPHLGYMCARPSATIIIFSEDPTCTNSGESNKDTNSSVSLLRWLEEATMRRPGSSSLCTVMCVYVCVCTRVFGSVCTHVHTKDSTAT
eukprot:scaffold124399_cov21-Tisochrysis_lutea.AAC.2